MPAFLAENALIGVNVRVENRIQIHVHQVGKVLLVGGGHRVDGLIRIGHSIEKGIKRSLHHLDKRVLHRKVAGAAQDGVLDDVGNARGILRRCAEADVEHLVIVVIGQKSNARAAFVVPQHVSAAAKVRQKAFRLHGVGTQRL